MHDILKSLPKGLLADVKAMMEGTNKLDPIGKETKDIDNDVEQIDELSKKKLGQYIKKAASDLGNKAYDRNLAPATKRSRGIYKATDKIMTKEELEELAEIAETITEEEFEQLDELSKATLVSYKNKATADPAFVKRKGKVSHVRKAIMAKRNAGLERAGKKIAKHSEAEWAALTKKRVDSSAKIHDHFNKNAPKVLAKHGYTLTSDGSKYSTYSKPHPTGHQFNVTLAKHRSASDIEDGYPATHKITNTSGWSGESHKTHDSLYWSRHEGKSDADHKKEAMTEFENALKKHHENRDNDMHRESFVASGKMLSEEETAADRLAHHHNHIKTLLKSLGEHMDKQASKAKETINHKGQKGPHWGHVSTFASLAADLGEVHDSVAQVNQMNEGYKIPSNYAELAAKKKRRDRAMKNDDGSLKPVKLTKGWGDDGKSMKANYGKLTKEELEFLDQLNTGELDEARGRPARSVVNQGFTIHPKTKEKLMHNNPTHMARIEKLQKIGSLPKPKIEASQHIMQQLQKASISMSGSGKVNYHDGETHAIHTNHASRLIAKYAGLKPGDKEAFQKKIQTSHANMMSELK